MKSKMTKTEAVAFGLSMAITIATMIIVCSLVQILIFSLAIDLMIANGYSEFASEVMAFVASLTSLYGISYLVKLVLKKGNK